MFTILCFLGCQDKISQLSDTSETENEFVPNIPTSQCGSEPYNWISTATMGSIIEIEDVDELSLGSSTINLLLEQFNLGDMVPVPYDVKTYKVRYLTQNRGEAVETTGLITLPIGRTSPAPPLLWAHPTTGFSDNCAPSAMGIEGAAFPILWASMGYAVSAPDYLGMAGWGEPSGRLHPYFVAEATAVASLDGLRALSNVVESREPELSLQKDKTIFWGASEGGYAALISDRYRPHYLPEFQSVATVAAVPATNLQELARLSMEDLHESSLALVAVMATMSDWYGLADLEDFLQPELIDGLPTDLQLCGDFASTEGISTVDDLFLSETISAGINQDWAALDPFGCFFEENTLINLSLSVESSAPTLIITAEKDDLALPSPVRSDILFLCAAGQQIEHRECADAEHVAGAVDTLEWQIEWISDRIEERPLENTCVLSEPIICDE